MIFLRFNKDLAACGYVYNVLLLSGTTRAWMSHWPHRPGAKESKAASTNVTQGHKMLSKLVFRPAFAWQAQDVFLPCKYPSRACAYLQNPGKISHPWVAVHSHQIVPFKIKELLSSALNYAACFPGWAGTANEATMQRKLLNCARKQRLGGGETAALWKTQTLKHFLVK